MDTTKGMRTTKVLLQAWQDVVIFVSSLSASVLAGQAPLGFCLLSFTFISLFSSGGGRTQQLSLPAAITDRYTPPEVESVLELRDDVT